MLHGFIMLPLDFGRATAISTLDDRSCLTCLASNPINQ
jgi:hypothetical protein